MEEMEGDFAMRMNTLPNFVRRGAPPRTGPIVYVSSELALLPAADREVLTANSPVQQPSWPYCRSRADSELVGRRYSSGAHSLPLRVRCDGQASVGPAGRSR
jgi:hypothetical protein